jgi:hypothetical protein
MSQAKHTPSLDKNNDPVYPTLISSITRNKLIPALEKIDSAGFDPYREVIIMKVGLSNR